MTEMLTPAEIAEARDVHEHATAGKWTVYAEYNVFSGDRHSATGWQGNDGIDYARRNANNAEYLVLAANLLPRALATIEALQAQLIEAREEAESWRHSGELPMLMGLQTCA